MKDKSTKEITEWCFSCQNKSVCQKLARSCKKWKSAKNRYTPFWHEGLQLQSNQVKRTPQEYINQLTPGTFCKKCVFWTFWCFLSWISAKLALIRSKMHLQLNSLPFLPPASCFTTMWLGHVQESKFWDCFWTRKCPTSLGFSIFGIFFSLSFFSFSFLFAAVIDLLGLLAVKKLLRKHHRDGQILAWSSQV